MTTKGLDCMLTLFLLVIALLFTIIDLVKADGKIWLGWAVLILILLQLLPLAAHVAR